MNTHQPDTELTDRLAMNLLHRPSHHWVLAAVCLTAAIFLLNAIWIPVKAELAQHLLERAWLRTLEHAGPAERPGHPVLGSASRGREIYEGTAACASCHGFQGQGGVGPALGNPAFLERAPEGEWVEETRALLAELR